MSETCNCTPTAPVARGQPYRLPLNRDVVDAATRKKHGGLMKDTDVHFGRAISIQELAESPIAKLAGLIEEKEFAPFEWYALPGAPEFPVEMKIEWPNHPAETHFSGRIPLRVASGANLSRVELAQWIAQAVKRVIYKCRASYTGDEHCCWLVGMDNDPFGLTARDVYLVALEHIDAFTFVPVLHVLPSREPFVLPMSCPRMRTTRAIHDGEDELEIECTRWKLRRRRVSDKS